MREEPEYREVGTTGRLYYDRQVKLAEKSDGLQVFRTSKDGHWIPFEIRSVVDAPLLYQGALAFESKNAGHRKLVVQNVLPSGEVADELRIRIVSCPLFGDADRPDVLNRVLEGEGKTGSSVFISGYLT